MTEKKRLRSEHAGEKAQSGRRIARIENVRRFVQAEQAIAANLHLTVFKNADICSKGTHAASG